MNVLLEGILTALSRGERAVLCTVMASSGSAPRGAGSRMAVYRDGHTQGTVGGGRVELLAVEKALTVLESGEPSMQGYTLSGGETADIGMICGGNVTVYFQCFSPGNAGDTALLRCMAETAQKNVNAWLVSKIEHGVLAETAVYDGDAGFLHTETIRESDVLPLLSADAVLTAGEPMWYAEPIAVRGTVYIFGGGHVGRELVPLLSHVGFRVAVYDERESLAVPEAFPGAKEVICCAYSQIPARITLTADDYAVVMTPGHQADFEVLNTVLRSPCTYVGCIGSRTKVAAVNERLRQAGIPETAIERLHAPIGLPIGGKTPAEIAVSVGAELILHRSKRRKMS